MQERLQNVTQRATASTSVVLVLCLLSGGCGRDDGPQRVAVHGSVRLANATLKSGQIRFIPTGSTSGPSAAAVIVDGRYEFTSDDGPLIGTHRIEIEATNYLGFEIDDERAFAEFARSGGTRDRQKTKNPVPEQYNVRSTLTRTVDADDETPLDFDLSPDQALANR
jgi:hypothetical protein